MVYNKFSIPADVKVNSVLLGLFLSLQTIMVYLFPSAEGGVATGGLLGIMYIACVALIILNLLLTGTFSFKKIPLVGFLIAVILMVFYKYTQNIIGEPRTPFALYLMFTVMAFLMPMLTRIDSKIFFRTIMLISLLALFRMDAVLAPMIASRGTITMGYSYSFLTPVLVSLSYLIFFFKTDSATWKAIMGLSIIVNIVIAFMLIKYGSRGPVVAILSMIAIPYILDFSKSKSGLHLKEGKTVIFIACLAFGLVFFIPVLEFLKTFFSNFGLSLNFIDKFLRLSESDNIGGDRELIYEITMYGIYQRPLFGHGCDQFENITGFSYPHNFFLQMLYDGGAILTTFIFIPLLRRLWKWKSECTKANFVIIMTLFFASVPGSMVSGDLWQMVELWFFFGAVFSKQFVYKSILK